VKKNLSTLKNRITPTTDFFVFVHPVFVLESLVLYDIVEYIERKYLGEVYLLVPEELEGLRKVLDDKISKNTIVFPVEEEISGYMKQKGLVASWRLFRGLVQDFLAKMDYSGVIVFPSCMEFLVSIDITGFLLGLDYPLLEATPSFELRNNFFFVNGFYGIPCSELTLISRSRKKELQERLEYSLKSFCNKTYEETISLRLLYDTVKEHSLEVLFSIQKVPLSLYDTKNVTKCRYCGGTAGGNKYCYWCGEFFEYFKK